MKKLGNILFSRLVLIFLAIVIQFFWLATVLYQFSLQFTFINLGFRAVALILAIIISDKDGNAAGRMSYAAKDGENRSGKTAFLGPEN